MARKRIDGRPLLEVLESLPGKQVVKVGAKEGGAFFFVGDARWLIDRISSADYTVRRDWQMKANIADGKLKEMVETAPTYAEWLSKVYRTAHCNACDFLKKRTKYEDYLKAIDEHHGNMIHRAEVAEKVRKIADGYVSLQDRTVISLRDADVTQDEGVLIIMVEGHERGTVWVMSDTTANKYLYLRKDGRQEKDGKGETVEMEDEEDG